MFYRRDQVFRDENSIWIQAANVHNASEAIGQFIAENFLLFSKILYLQLNWVEKFE